MRQAVGPSGRVLPLAFDPHPANVLRPGAAPARLTTAEQRVRFLRELGADEVELLTPQRELLAHPPEAFIDALRRRIRFDVIVEGPDFRFGQGRGGDLSLLRTIGAALGFHVVEVAAVELPLRCQSVVPARSTIIRALLSDGRVEDAATLLGRPHELECRVVPGDQRGRVIGYPTANLEHGDRQLPGDGVYSGSATLPGGAVHRAAISIGTKPTFGTHAMTCEAHLLDWSGDLDAYGWTIRLRVERRLRDQLAFPALEPLLERMAEDMAAVRGCA